MNPAVTIALIGFLGIPLVIGTAECARDAQVSDRAAACLAAPCAPGRERVFETQGQSEVCACRAAVP